jgi:O-acetyl-ADP-ribose deacetylase (regulator of RNase III)
LIELMSENDSIFESGAEALVCPVNCVGVMGKGLALEFKKRWKSFDSDCRDATLRGHLRLGQVWVYPTLEAHLVAFPTKEYFRNPSRIDYIVAGLCSLKNSVISYQWKSIAIPALGCGLGGLDWNDVRPLIEEAFQDLPDVRVMLYPPKEG